MGSSIPTAMQPSLALSLAPHDRCSCGVVRYLRVLRCPAAHVWAMRPAGHRARACMQACTSWRRGAPLQTHALWRKGWCWAASARSSLSCTCMPPTSTTRAALRMLCTPASPSQVCRASWHTVHADSAGQCVMLRCLDEAAGFQHVAAMLVLLAAAHCAHAWPCSAGAPCMHSRLTRADVLDTFDAGEADNKPGSTTPAAMVFAGPDWSLGDLLSDHLAGMSPPGELDEMRALSSLWSACAAWSWRFS